MSRNGIADILYMVPRPIAHHRVVALIALMCMMVCATTSFAADRYVYPGAIIRASNRTSAFSAVDSGFGEQQRSRISR